MQSTTAVQSRERVLMAEVEGLKEDLSAAREELELLRLEAITSNRLAEDCQMQLDAVRAARSKDRDELRQEMEDKVCACVRVCPCSWCERTVKNTVRGEDDGDCGGDSHTGGQGGWLARGGAGVDVLRCMCAHVRTCA